MSERDRAIRIAVLFPSTGLIDGELCDLAEARGAEALLFKVSPAAIADPRDERAVARMTQEMGDPALLAQMAAQAADVHPHVVAWACTSGSFLTEGSGLEQVRAMSDALGGIPATTTSLAIVSRLKALGAKRIAVVTPYHPGVGRRFVTYLEAAGFAVGKDAHAGRGSDEEVGRLGYDDIAPLARAVVDRASEALVIPCTGLRAQRLEAQLGDEFGIPVLLANSATLDHALELARGSPR